MQDSDAADAGAVSPAPPTAADMTAADIPADAGGPTRIFGTWFDPARPRRTGLLGAALPLTAAGLGAAAVALVHFRDPHVEGAYGLCPVWVLFGVYCPGCGGMRAVHNLTDGHIIDALHSNLLALPVLLAFALWVGDWTVRAWRGAPMRLPSFGLPTVWLVMAFLTGYTVLRNTPWGTWLTPV